MVLLGLFESFVWQIYLMGTYLYLLFSRILTAFIISGVLTKKWVWVLPFPICVLLGPSWTLGQWKICFGDLLIHTHNFYFDRFGHYMILKFFLLTDRHTDRPTNLDIEAPCRSLKRDDVKSLSEKKSKKITREITLKV